MSEKAICRYMKMITLEKLRDSLRDWKYVVTVAARDRRRGRAVRSTGWSRSSETQTGVRLKPDPSHRLEVWLSQTPFSSYATRTECTGGSFVAAVNHVPPASLEPKTSPDVAPK